MKIGIMTMHRVYNYGSFLQAYGLKRMIESLGHEVVFVDYMPDKPNFENRSDYVRYFKGCIKKTIFRVLDNNPITPLNKLLPVQLRYSVNAHRNYNSIYWKHLGLTNKKRYRTPVDVLVIGSDEVFNCLNINAEAGNSRELFGYGSKAKKVITYAASFGNTTIEGMKDRGVLDTVKADLNDIAMFSVRDKNSYEIVKQLTGREDISENLDPVLMYDFPEVKRKKIDVQNYIIVYAYRGRLSEKEIEAIKAFANKKNKKIVCVGGYHSFCDIYVQDSPLEVFEYFKQADYVITDTFHGSIFSIINHAKLGVFVRKGHGKTYGNNEKLSDLLRRLGLQDRIITSLDAMEEVLDKTIDYEKVDSIIKDERERTKQYLKANLG